MPEYLAPGVFVEEIPRSPKPIEGVPTSTAAFLGEAERGPTWPMLVTSSSEYSRLFGATHAPDKYLPYAVGGFFENGGKRLFVCRITGAGATHARRAFGPVTLYAIGPGKWGNHLYARIDAPAPAPAQNPPATPATFRLRLAYWANPPDGFEPFDVFAPADAAAPGARPAPTAVETFEAVTPRAVIGSALVYLDYGDDPAPDVMPAFEGGALTHGTDGDTVTASDFLGKEGVDGRFTAQGLDALGEKEFDEVALIHAPHPGADVDAIHQVIVAHCESNRFRFALLDCNPGTTPITSLDPRTQLDTQFAAFYCPWLTVADPMSGAQTTVPPGGYVAGIYVRTDSERGVHAAPANEVVRGALDVEVAIHDSEQQVLNPRGVNAIRSFPGRGIRVWGARTLSSDPEWKYVNLRRLFIYLERSIERGLQWAVFEPNGEGLWARVTDSVQLFLRTTWRNGALQGRTEQEAYFVKCDRTTMTENDIQSGQLICLIGVAAIKPAEFVILRIGVRAAAAVV